MFSRHRPIEPRKDIAYSVTAIDRLITELAGYDVVKVEQVRRAKYLDTLRMIVQVNEKAKKIRK
jgi:hypothetical protein